MSSCAFCGAPASLLCDGRLDNGQTCDKPVCRACAVNLALVHGQDKHGRRRCDTRDLCPDCVKAQRDWMKPTPAA